MPEDRREQILACAAALFARRGVAATTVRQIADEVGILSGSLYHHFESKEAIVDEIVSSYLEDLRGRYKQVLAGDEDPRTRLANLILASFQTVEAHPHATEIYQNERYRFLKSAAKEVQNIWLEVITAGMAQGAFRADLDPKVVYRLLRDAVWMSARWFTPSRDYPTARLARDCTAVFLDGLAARP